MAIGYNTSQYHLAPLLKTSTNSAAFTMVLSDEATIAIVALMVTLSPVVLALAKMLNQLRQNRQCRNALNMATTMTRVSDLVLILREW